MSDKTKKKVNLNKERLLQRLDLLGYEAYKKLLDLEDGKTEQPINKMSINVVRLDYILPLPILLYTFDIHQKIQYHEMNRNKDEELAYIKITDMEHAIQGNNYKLIEYDVIPFNPDFYGIMTKQALKKAVESYNQLYEEGQRKLFGSKTSKKKQKESDLVSEVSPDTTSQVSPANKDKLVKYAYEIPKWILKKNKRKEQLLEKIKTKEELRKLNYINNDVDIKSLIYKFPGHEQDFVIVDDDKEGYIRMRYKGHEPTIMNEISKLNNQPVMEHIKIFQEGKEREQDYDDKKDRRERIQTRQKKRRKRRQTRRKRRHKFDFKKVKREKKEIRFEKLATMF